MPRALFVFATVAAFAQCKAVVVDIMGYVYYQNYADTFFYNGDSSATACVALPIDGGEVTLYKRNSSSGWDQYGSTILSDDGLYVFEDIDVGRDAGDLCTHSDWFKVFVDARDSLPSGWAYPVTLIRFSHNEVRPNGIPDEGTIRVDFVFESSAWYVYDGSSLDVDMLTGHWVSENDSTAFSLEHGNGEASCPISENSIEIGSCLRGHWSNAECFDAWETEDEYSEYVFWPINGDEGDALGWYYTYWTEPWPSFAKHVNTNNDVLIVIDYVYLQPSN